MAMFMSGYGPIPEIVFQNELRYTNVNRFLASLPVISSSYYGADFLENEITAANNMFPDVLAASKGLYVYDNEEYTEEYHRVAMPKDKLTASDLNSELRSFLTPFIFQELAFADVPSIAITEFFNCTDS